MKETAAEFLRRRGLWEDGRGWSWDASHTLTRDEKDAIYAIGRAQDALEECRCQASKERSND